MHRTIKNVFRLMALLGGLAAHTPAMAASFDCAQAKAPREQLICNDPQLSDLDKQLGQVYEEKRALLSPHGTELLKQSEQSWLHFVGIVCPVAVPADAPQWKKPEFCFKKEYENRLKDLAQVGLTLGPFIFSRVDIYSAKPSGDDAGADAGFYANHVAYPQIDNPQSPQAAIWNQQNVKSVPTDGDCGYGDYDTDYEIGYANKSLISTQWNFYEYCHGTPHGRFWTNTKNMVLLPEVRTLAARDVFGTDGPTIEKLQKLFWDALLAQGWTPPERLANEIKSQLMAKVTHPEEWLFNKDGIKISFSAYEGGCYVCNPDPVVLPWADLKPLLAPKAVVP